MIFGFGMPILFPICAVALIVRYFVEVSSLFYSYDVSKKFEKAISEQVMTILLFAPAFYLIFGYWMISSKQLLSNDYLTQIATEDDIIPSDHTLSTMISLEGWKAPNWAFLGAFLFVFILIVVKFSRIYFKFGKEDL